MNSQSSRLALILLIAAVAALALSRNPTLKLRGWGVQADLTGFNLTADSSPRSGVSSLELRRRGVSLKVDRTETGDPDGLLNGRKILLASLYEPTTSPYPGVITNTLSCPENLKPQTIEVSSSRVVYSLPAGERDNYGVCSQDLVTERSAEGIMICQGAVMEVRAFGESTEDVLPVVESFRCQS